MLSQIMSKKEFEKIRRYYRNEAVRRRIKEFNGGDEPTYEYLVGFGEFLARKGYRRPLKLIEGNDSIEGLMEMGLDLFRSVWDRKATLAVWDVEYFNLDSWKGLYQDQLTHFELMEPTYQAIRKTMDGYGVPCLNDSTASGYHYISLIPFSSPVHRRLEEVGPVEETLLEKYGRVPGGDYKRKRPVTERDARGYSGIGRLIEFLSHEVIRKARRESKLHITISDAVHDRTDRGREGMNLDITQYADPLYMRDIRITFSTHQKHKVHVGKVGIKTARQFPVYATVPRNGLSFRELFEIRKDLEKATEYAAQCTGVIPDASAGWEKVIEKYLASPLSRFHREFDSVRHEPPKRWPKTYWKLDLKTLPACAGNSLRNATWGLTSPTSLQTFCRVLFSQGWHPKHIAGLIRSYYEKVELNWPINWEKYHAETRANFWARIYCGMIVTGVDSLDDFDCIHQSEKGYCPYPWCGFKLDDCREAIREKL